MRAALTAAIVAIWTTIAAGGAAAMPVPKLPAPVSMPALPPGSSPRGVELARVVADIPDGQVWEHSGTTPCVMDYEEYRWSSRNSELYPEQFSKAFNDELSKAGFPNSTSDNLFEKHLSSNPLSVGARITNIQSYICNGVFGAQDTMLMDVEWQILDPLKQQVIAKIKTSAGVKRAIGRLSDVQFALFDAFRENTRSLLADTKFREAVLKADTGPSHIALSGPISLTAANASSARPIGEVSAAVVALFTDTAMGSGFLISDDGYVLTNQHVVGDATKVRVRWSDGLETTGEVVRSEKRRDVALVKTDPRGRPPLALLRGTPVVGSGVYAVGTPLDAALQNTVTRGIVSANRFIDGFAFIQSDVSIDHGNSGGPLLDEKGRVIGITVIKIAPDDGQRNLNLFIPIGDALDFLSLKAAG